ncbi:MAG: hypothetical protein K1000chlam1_01373, partial [Candidatus Anoxychlamydiales bacterium]|nr:hypothetical protein [Candidatus Anoxychlamydiales bacterium]
TSNYGYYVFYEKNDNRTQYEWIVQSLIEDPATRRAVININQTYHKEFATKDFPCSLSMVFFIKENELHCVVFSRSTDVFYGLPYDIGFFSFVNELIYADLKQREPKKFKDLKLGQTSIHCVCTQIYEMTRKKALATLNKENKRYQDLQMPIIKDARGVLKDIYNETFTTDVMQWVYDHSE